MEKVDTGGESQGKDIGDGDRQGSFTCVTVYFKERGQHQPFKPDTDKLR